MTTLETQQVESRGATSTRGATPEQAVRREGYKEPGRAGNVALWVVQVLTAAAFVMAGFGKLTSDPRTVWVFEQIGVGHWLRYLLGVLELAGAVALLTRRLSGLAGLAFVALTVGAVITNMAILGVSPAPPAFLLVFAGVIAWGRRRRTAELFRTT